MLSDLSRFEQKHAGGLPPGTQIVPIDGEPEGEGFFLVFLGRQNNGERIARLFGANMELEEIVDSFLRAMAEVNDRGHKKIDIA